MKPEVRLESLLLSLFTSEELVRWLRNLLDVRLVDEIWVTGVPPTYAVHHTILSLQRRGLVNEAFFRGLIAERPGRSADIQLAAKWWLDHPKHFLLSPWVSFDGGRVNRFSFPDSCVCVELPNDADEERMHRDIDAAVFDCGAYGSFAKLLDTLYVEYLRNRFAPVSYGREWLLTLRFRVLMPWEWLLNVRRGELGDTPRRWIAMKSLTDVGILPGVALSVLDLRRIDLLKPGKLYGVAVNNEKICTIFDSNPKALWFFDDALLVETPPESVVPDAYLCTGVYLAMDGFERGTPSTGAWAQAREPTKVEIEDWRGYLVELP